MYYYEVMVFFLINLAFFSNFLEVKNYLDYGSIYPIKVIISFSNMCKFLKTFANTE